MWTRCARLSLRSSRRHETMRTVFTAVEGVPYQTVLDQTGLNGIELPFDVIDLSHEPAPEQAARARVQTLIAQPFDVARGPLFRVELARLGSERYLLALAMHHIISDGVSITVLAREIGELYTAHRAGRAATLPELTIQYRDFAAWQNAYLQLPDAEAHRAYWLRTLAAPLPIVELPTDAVRPAAPSFAGREELFSIDREVFEPFRRLCQAQGASLFMGLVAAVTTLMHRYSGAEDLIVGSPIAGRDHVNIDHAIGVFINTLALRTTIQPHLSFKEVIAATRRTVVDAFDHRTYPFDRLVQDLDVPRDFSRSPVFDVMVILQNQHAEDFALDGLRVSPVYEHSGASQFDLTFTFHERGHAIALGLEYRTDLFHRDRIGRMGGHLITLIESAVRDPATPVGRLNILTPSERRLLVDECNQTARTYRLDRTVLDLFAERVRQQPAALAVTCGAESLTYETLDTQSNALAARLRSRGAGPGQLVGLCVERSVDMLVGLLGILKSGAAYVPLDPAFPPARLELMMRDSRALLLLTQTALVDLIGAGSGAGAAAADRLPDRRSRLSRQSRRSGRSRHSGTSRSRRDAGPDNLAYVNYTSGSTGTPKGVQVTHRNLRTSCSRWQTRQACRRLA